MDSTGVQLQSGAWLPSTRHILGLAGLWLAYKVLEAIYNISPLHPLSSIPGPRLAAATYLPEFYHDVIRFGCYTKEISRMHKVYGGYPIAYNAPAYKLTPSPSLPGPIIRINPNEIHCDDISFADEIYAIGGRKRDKPVHQINGSA
jgi:hypothetical protein